MFHHTDNHATVEARLTAVRNAVSSETLTVIYSHNTALPQPVTVTDAHIKEEVARGQVRELIASHPLCSTELSRLLACDPSVWVRAAVAGATSDGAILNLLTVDEHSRVKEAVCLNVATPTYLLRLLAEDDDPLVRETADRVLNPSRGTVFKVEVVRDGDVYGYSSADFTEEFSLVS